MDNKNIRIAPPEFWRFVFIIYVCFFHFEEDVYDGACILANAGYLGVDYFLLISGFAVSYSYSRKPIESPLRYAFDKAKKIYPDFLFAIIVMFLLWLIYESTDLRSVLNHIYECRLQYFLVNAFIWTKFETGPLWFLSYWLVGIIVLVFVLKKRSMFVVGGFAISFMSWHFYYRGLLQDDLVVPQFLWSVRLIRCVSEVIIGAMAYELTEKLKCIQLSSLGKIVFSAFEILVILYVMIIMSRSGRNHVDYFVCVGFVVIIIMSFWRQTWVSKLLDNRYSQLLGTLSLPIYLYHPFCIRLSDIYCHNNSHKFVMYIALFGGIIITSFLFHLFVERYFSRFLKAICNKMIIRE